MRVTGGSLRSRRIRAPQGPWVQPAPDMVREAVFSILRAAVPGARVLDLFACSGSFGIEALSRGAASALFVEKDPAAARVISQNVESLGLAGASEVLARDALSIRPFLKRRGSRFDLAFVDPPYALSEGTQTRRALEDLVAGLFNEDILDEGAILVFRQRKGGSAVLAEDGSIRRDTRCYGSTQVTFLERAGG